MLQVICYVRRVLIGLMAFFLLGLAGCGESPVSLSEWTVKRSADGDLVATLKLQNPSSKGIAGLRVLIDVGGVDHRGGNRLFESNAQVPPGATRTIEAIAPNRNNWDFKYQANAEKGYEVEALIYD